jgi:hypothetical protein
MFIAYLLPKPSDVFNLLEDGIQWMAKGDTKQEAEANLRALFDKQMKEEHYDATETETVWNDHQFYIAEV